MTPSDEPAKVEPSTSQSILLYVVSPSAEAQRLTFANTPTSTTIAELKERIRNVVPSKPLPERQRLIYQGKPLVRPEVTLESVIGSEAISTLGTFTLHLVLPPPDSGGNGNASEVHRGLQHNPSTASYGNSVNALRALQHNAALAHFSNAQRGEDAQQGRTAAENTVSRPQHPGAENGSTSDVLREPQRHRAHYTGYRNSEEALRALQHNAALAHYSRVQQGGPTQQNRVATENTGPGTLQNQGVGQRPPGFHSQYHLPQHIPQSDTLDYQEASLPQFGVSRNSTLHPSEGYSGNTDTLRGPYSGPPTTNNAEDHGPRLPPSSSGAPNPGLPQILNPDNRTPHQVGSLSNGQHDVAGGQVPANGPREMNGASETVVREGQIPGGGQWRMVINQTTVSAPNNHLPGISAGVGTGQQVPNLPAPTAPENAALGNPTQFNTRSTAEAAARLQQSMASITGLMQNGMPSANMPSTNMPPTNMPPANIPAARTQNSFPPMVYLIQSPTGYRALLLPPQAANAQTPNLANASINTNVMFPAQQFPRYQQNAAAFSPRPQPPLHAYQEYPRYHQNTHVFPQQPQPLQYVNQQLPYMTQPHPPRPQGDDDDEDDGGDLYENYPPPRIAAGVPNPYVVGQDQAAPPGREREEVLHMLRILIPLGGHLWLIIRLLGFVYLFAGSATSWRTAMLVTIAIFIFFNHLGYLRPFYRVVADPIRRHLEGLIQVDGERPAVAQTGAMRREQRGVPTPEEAAERLLREREQRDISYLWTTLRRVERAVALFLASLVPGVGEHHIAARDAAEEAARIREREEREIAQQAEARVEREAADGEQGQVQEPGEDGNLDRERSENERDDESEGVRRRHNRQAQAEEQVVASGAL